MKLLKYLSFTSLLIVAPSAFAESTKINISKTNDRTGSTVNTELTNSTTTNPDGSIKTVDKEAVSVDPKGMNNKINSYSQHESVKEADGDYEHKNKIKHADGTYEELDESKETSKHILDKGKTTTTTKTKIIDPKGLGNKEESQIKEQVVDHADGTQSTTVTESH